MSPRKSSTSSGRAPTLRPRYLGLEVAGEHFPPPSPRWWETTLRRCLDRSAVPGRFRLIRSEGYRAIAEVDQFQAPAARRAWTTSVDDPAVRLFPRRTWGTLRGAKAWMRGRPRPPIR
ncbi:MAG: hypothetical protein L3J68_04135 [Thermoplasmata archaeon]|nr:hypothetical protein [Thermoplasmata archaeon]